MGRPRNTYVVTFRYDQLKHDVGIPLEEWPALYAKYFGVKLVRSAIYHWFARRSMPLERLMQIMHIVRMERAERFDFWRYIDAPDPLADDVHLDKAA